MKGWLRRIRGALGTALTWATGWAPIGAVLGLVLGVSLGGPAGVGAAVILNATVFGVLGFVGGGIFSVVLRLAEGRRRFDELSLPRFTALGAAGGLVLGGLAVSAGLWGALAFPLVGVVIAGTATALGAASAAGSLALARQADDAELLDSGAELAEVELGEGESRRLLGKSD